MSEPIDKANIHQDSEDLQRGFDDIRDAYICLALAQHGITADSNATVAEIVEPALLEQIYRESEIKAREALEACEASL